MRFNLSVISQKGESQNGCFKKTKHAKFSEKRTFLTLWYLHAARQIFRKANSSYPLIRTRTCTYQGVNVRFSENLACFVFLKHPFWDSPFCLITDEFSHYRIFTRTRNFLIEMYNYTLIMTKNISHSSMLWQKYFITFERVSTYFRPKLVRNRNKMFMKSSGKILKVFKHNRRCKLGYLFLVSTLSLFI